jgi:hypothetical protein
MGMPLSSSTRTTDRRSLAGPGEPVSRGIGSWSGGNGKVPEPA